MLGHTQESLMRWTILCLFLASSLCYHQSRNLEDLEFETVALYGNTEVVAYYYTILLMGNPAQEQAVIVDTGSSILNFACSNCPQDYCGTHQNEHFSIEHSTTFAELTCAEVGSCAACREDRCQFSVHYSEGSQIHGVYVQDEIRFDIYAADSDGFRSNFVCNDKETNFIKSQRADGILGLNNKGHLIEDAYRDNPNIDHDVFSICIGHQGGYMNIGAAGPLVEEIGWIPYSEGNQYSIHLEKVTVNGETKSFQTARRPFLDSGTTDVFLETSVYEFVIEQLNEFCKQEGKCPGEKNTKGFDTCWIRPSDQIEEHFFSLFPELVFTFSGFDFAWHPAEYLSGYSQGMKPNNPEQASFYHCLSIQKYGHTILGGPFMKNYNIIFDKGEKMVGFQRATCRPPISDREHYEMIQFILSKAELPKVTVHPRLEHESEVAEDSLSAKSDSHWKIYTLVAVVLVLTAIIVTLVVKRYKHVIWRQNRNVQVELQEDPYISSGPVVTFGTE